MHGVYTENIWRGFGPADLATLTVISGNTLPGTRWSSQIRLLLYLGQPIIHLMLITEVLNWLLNNNEVNAASERRLRKYADCSHHAVVLLEVRTIAAEHMRQGALPYCCISYTHTHRAHIRFDIFLYDPLNPQNFPGLLTDMQKWTQDMEKPTSHHRQPSDIEHNSETEACWESILVGSSSSIKL